MHYAQFVLIPFSVNDDCADCDQIQNLRDDDHDVSDAGQTVLIDAETQGQDGLELFGVSRICERRGENTRARKLYEKSIASVLPAETDRAARRSLARLAKRDGDFALACELWRSSLGNSRQGYEAYEQLAIYYEHQLATLSRPGKSCVRHSTNSGARTTLAPLCPMHIARSVENLSIDWLGWNEKPGGRS